MSELNQKAFDSNFEEKEQRKNDRRKDNDRRSKDRRRHPETK